MQSTSITEEQIYAAEAFIADYLKLDVMPEFRRFRERVNSIITETQNITLEAPNLSMEQRELYRIHRLALVTLLREYDGEFQRHMHTLFAVGKLPPELYHRYSPPIEEAKEILNESVNPFSAPLPAAPLNQ